MEMKEVDTREREREIKRDVCVREGERESERARTSGGIQYIV